VEVTIGRTRQALATLGKRYDKNRCGVIRGDRSHASLLVGLIRSSLSWSGPNSFGWSLVALLIGVVAYRSYLSRPSRFSGWSLVSSLIGLRLRIAKV